MHIARLETQTRHEGTLLKLTIPSAMLAELIEDGHMVDWRVTREDLAAIDLSGLSLDLLDGEIDRLIIQAYDEVPPSEMQVELDDL
jgi:hypothetical protein